MPLKYPEFLQRKCKQGDNYYHHPLYQVMWKVCMLNQNNEGQEIEKVT